MWYPTEFGIMLEQYYIFRGNRNSRYYVRLLATPSHKQCADSEPQKFVKEGAILCQEPVAYHSMSGQRTCYIPTLNPI